MLRFYPIFLQFKRGNIESECQIFKEFLIDVHHLADNERKKIEKHVADMIAQSPADSGEIYEHYEDQFAMYETKYVEIGNNAMFVTAYSFFENQLKQIHEVVDQNLTTKLPLLRAPKPDNRSYAEKTKDKIYDITGLTFTSIEPKWIRINELRIIRNLITHNGANAFQDSGTTARDIESKRIIGTIPEITLQPNGDFIINNIDLVLNFIDLCEEYLRGVIAVLQTVNPINTK